MVPEELAYGRSAGDGAQRDHDGLETATDGGRPLWALQTADGLGLEKGGVLRVEARVAGRVQSPTMQDPMGTPVSTRSL